MTLDTHACAAAPCREACPPAHLMCVRHWRMVPMALRREIWTALRAVRRVPATRAEDYLQAVRALRATQDAAIAAVRAKEVAKQDRIDKVQNTLGI